ncbi:unnamed protein product [Mucor hiemalis]
MQNNSNEEQTQYGNTEREVEDRDLATFYCTPCGMQMSRKDHYKRHLKSQTHRRTIATALLESGNIGFSQQGLSDMDGADDDYEGEDYYVEVYEEGEDEGEESDFDARFDLEEEYEEEDEQDDEIEELEEDDEVNEEESPDTEMGEASEDIPNIPSAFPFNDELFMHAILYLRSTGSLYSELEVTRLLRFAKKMCEVAVRVRDNEYKEAIGKLRVVDRIPAAALVQKIENKNRLLKKFPRPNGIIHYLDTHHNVLHLPYTEHTVKISRKQGQRTTVEEKVLYMNNPSEILKVCLAQPTISPEMSRLPDRTPGQCIDMSQAGKWNSHPDFQWPMIRYEDGAEKKQLWIGDRIEYSLNGQRYSNFVSGFYTLNRKDIHVESFPDLFFPNVSNQPFCDVKKVSQPLSYLLDLLFSNYGEAINPKACYMVNSEENGNFSNPFYRFSTGLHPVQNEVISRSRKFKKLIESSNTPLFVKVVPLTLFSGDTSGNRSKKRNCFYSWSMTPAALPLSMRNQKISQHFICASNEMKASEMLKPLVDDLVELKKGITMYDHEQKEVVLVVSPILFINADNPRHADVSCTMHSAAAYPCRFCYWHQDDKRSARTTHVSPGDYVAVPRNTGHLKGFLNNFIPNGFPLMLKDKFRNNLSHDDCFKIGYKRTGGDELLRLSSWDPSKDCPVEILHTLLLGIVKYTWNLIADKLLNANQLKVIQDNIRQYHTKAFPTLNSSLFHYNFFLAVTIKSWCRTCQLC